MFWGHHPQIAVDSNIVILKFKLHYQSIRNKLYYTLLTKKQANRNIRHDISMVDYVCHMIEARAVTGMY